MAISVTFIIESFSHQCQLMVFHWILSNSKSPQVSRTRLRILAVLSSAVVWIVSTRPPTSKSSRPFNNPFVIVPNEPITIGTIVTFMFHSFIIIYSSRIFHISISWWFFTGVWVTASFLKSPGHVSVFWPSLAMLSFG